MKKNNVKPNILWKDRKHWAWFPFSFTVYSLSDERLYVKNGFFNTHYDETLLYRIVDICLKRSFKQKIFGTGTVILTTKADTQGKISLLNIKHPMEVNRMLSDAVEKSRSKQGVVGREFYGSDHLGHDHTEHGEPGKDFGGPGPDGFGHGPQGFGPGAENDGPGPDGHGPQGGYDFHDDHT